jgi:hypothetical protein
VPFGDPLEGVELSNKDIEEYGISGFLTESGVYNGDLYGRRPLKTAAAFHLVMPVLPTLKVQALAAKSQQGKV